MVSQKVFREIALSFPDAIELPHFDKASFRVGKKIFSTLWEKENRAMIKFTPLDQSVFCAFDKEIIYPVPGTWGKTGATFVELSKVRKDMLTDMLTVAYRTLKTRRK